MPSFSPRILPSWSSSTSVTRADPVLVILNVTGPAGTLAGCGSQPASDRAIDTAVAEGADCAGGPGLLQPAIRNAVETRRTAPPRRLITTVGSMLASPHSVVL